MCKEICKNELMMQRNNQDYIAAFIEGYICAIIGGRRMTTAKVSEEELDNAKHQLRSI